ncbi:hypothetical protein F4779DRAFT_639546 [Xylariaceae sp. FL0662B]|nr:hypothetical protein F4779DRAFT_639546 [Xylariaceae sp. FL0662B]
MALRIRHELFNELKLTSIPTRADEIRLQNAWSDYSIGLLQKEEFEGANSIIEGCRKHYEKWDSFESLLPYEWAKYYFVKSFTLMASGKSIEALEVSQRSVDLIKAESHGTWLFFHYSFVQATMYHHAGQTLEALRLHESIMDEVSEGKFRLNELSCLENIYMVATLKCASGDFDGARSTCENVLKDDKFEKCVAEIARLRFILWKTYLRLGLRESAPAIRARGLATQFISDHVSEIPHNVLMREGQDTLAVYDYFCTVQTRLTGRLASYRHGWA